MDEIKKLRGIYGMLCELSELEPETIEDSMKISKKADELGKDLFVTWIDILERQHELLMQIDTRLDAIDKRKE